MRRIEVCCASPQDVTEAFAGGATRVELCNRIEVGGVTPPNDWIKEAVMAYPHKAIHVLVRPREGNFVWSEKEIQTMIDSIETCKRFSVTGVVIGALTDKGEIDIPCMERLMAVAKPQLSVTFHRAFDECANPQKALEQIIELGCDRLLTSGLQPTAPEGVALLTDLVKQANNRIIVMPGSGVRTKNIAILEQQCGALEYHSTAHGESGHTERKTVAGLVN